LPDFEGKVEERFVPIGDGFALQALGLKEGRKAKVRMEGRSRLKGRKDGRKEGRPRLE
jgi:hypothetical protein